MQNPESFIALLDADLTLVPDDEDVLLRALDAFVALHCSVPHLPPVVQAVLQAMARARSDTVVTVLGRVFVKAVSMMADRVADLLAVVTAVAVQAEIVRERIVSAVSAFLKGEELFDDLDCARVRFGVPHVALLYFLLGTTGCEKVRGEVAELLSFVVLGDDVPFDMTSIPSSSANAGNVDMYRETVLVNGMKTPAVAAQGEAIATFFEELVWSRSKDAQRWGSRLLLELFVLLPNSRRKVLESMVIAMAGIKVAPSVSAHFCELLERICFSNGATFLLREHCPVLEDILDNIGFVSVKFDCRLVAAITRFSIMVPHLKDKIFLFLQKVSGSRSWKLQRVACAGFLTFIEHDVGSAETRDGACTTLGHMVNLVDVPVRAYLVSQLTTTIRRNPESWTRFESLIDIVLKRVLVLERHPEGDVRLTRNTTKAARGPASFDLAKGFELVGGEFIPRDDFRTMLHFCLQLRSQNGSCNLFLRRLMSYLGDQQTLHAPCETNEFQPTPLTRFKELCNLYETVHCLQLEGLSSSHTVCYAICLLVRELLISKERKLHNSGDRVSTRVSKAKDQDARLASVTCCEATVTERFGIGDSSEYVSFSAQNYLEVLQHIHDLDGIDNVCKMVVQREVMGHMLSELRTAVKEDAKSVANSTNISQLLIITRDCFASTCPWILTRPANVENPADSSNDSNRTSLSDDRSEEAEGIQATQKPGPISAMGSNASATLGMIHLPNKDIQVALESANTENLTKDIPFTLRQLSMQVLITLLTGNVVLDQWHSLHVVLGEVHPNDDHQCDHGSQSGTNAVSTRRKSREDSSQREKSCRKAALTVLGKVFCLEFQHSLSIALSVSYIDLLDHLLALDQSEKRDREVQKVVISTIMKLLRDYSVSNQQVLRKMLNLLMRAFDAIEGVEFCTTIFQWLGQHPCLLSSKHAMHAEDKGAQIGVEDFDIDILREAIDMDTARRSDEADCSPRTSLGENVPDAQELSSTDSATDFFDGNVMTSLNTTSRAKTHNSEPVRSMCLNESEETGFLAVLCMLNHLLSLAKRTIGQLRQYGKDIYIEVPSAEDILKGVTTSLKQLFQTPFGEMTSPRHSKMPLNIRKKVGTLLLTLTDIFEVQMRCDVKALQRLGKGIPSASCTLFGSKDVLELLVEEDSAEHLLNSLKDWDYGSRSGYLQERLDSTATAFLVCTKSSSSARVREFRALLQTRLAKRNIARKAQEKLNEREWDPMDSKNAFGSRPNKKQRIRSRNSYVDGCLQQEKGNDNFADLEEFIVPMETSEL